VVAVRFGSWCRYGGAALHPHRGGTQEGGVAGGSPLSWAPHSFSPASVIRARLPTHVDLLPRPCHEPAFTSSAITGTPKTCAESNCCVAPFLSARRRSAVGVVVTASPAIQSRLTSAPRLPQRVAFTASKSPFYSGTLIPGWVYLERGKRVELTTVRLRDIPVTIGADFCDPALDNLTASLDHLTRCFCGADKCLTIAAEDTNGGRLGG